MKKISISFIILALVATGCKSTSTCESLGLSTKSAILFVEKVNDSSREVIKYQCEPKKGKF